MVLAWKVSVRVSVPWVQIPPSPPFKEKEMYSDRHGITKIREGRRDSLSFSRDNHGEGHIAVLLHTPDIEDAYGDHSHIELDREQALQMRDWLDAWLKDDLDAREIKDNKDAQKEWSRVQNKLNNPQYKGDKK